MKENILKKESYLKCWTASDPPSRFMLYLDFVVPCFNSFLFKLQRTTNWLKSKKSFYLINKFFYPLHQVPKSDVLPPKQPFAPTHDQNPTASAYSM
jgi:hypothetical protein